MRSVVKSVDGVTGDDVANLREFMYAIYSMMGITVDFYNYTDGTAVRPFINDKYEVFCIDVAYWKLVEVLKKHGA